VQENIRLFLIFVHFHYQTLRYFTTNICAILFLKIVTFWNLVHFKSPSWRIFNHRVGVFLITELAVFCSVTWRSSVWELGGKYANFMLILTIWSKKCKKNLSNPKFFSTFATKKPQRSVAFLIQ